MSEFKGTKGKWYNEPGTLSIWHPSELNKRIAVVDYTMENGEETMEGKYNALLISKAPEMIAMLERCKEGFDKLNQPFITNDIEKLIKSATSTGG